MTKLENELLHALEYVLEWVADGQQDPLNRGLLDEIIQRANSQPGFKTTIITREQWEDAKNALS